MQFTIRNQILAQIEDRASFLEHLLGEYPRLLAEWTGKMDKSLKQDAEAFAEGDPDVFLDTYSSNLSAFDENEYREDMFYKAMLIMIYAYYESAISYLAKKTKTNGHLDDICKECKIELSEEAKEANSCIYSDIRIIRNQLVHNNMGYPQHRNDLLRICKEWPNVRFCDDEITITGADFILDSLKKEKMVLCELYQKIGYKHKRVQTGKIE